MVRTGHSGRELMVAVLCGVLGFIGCRSATIPTARLHQQLYEKYHQGNYQEVIDQYQALLGQYPDDPALHNNLAWVYASVPDEKFRDADKAITYARRAVKLTDARQAPYLATLAEAYRTAGQYDAALDALQQAVALNPTNDDYRQRVALVEREKQGLTAPVQAPGKSFPEPTMAPVEKGSSELVVEMARLYNQANRLLRGGDAGHLAQAVELYRQALTVAPDDAQVHNNLGVALGRQGHLGEAHKHLEQAAKLAPQMAHAHNNLAWLIVKQPSPSKVDLELAARSGSGAAKLTQWANPNVLDTLAQVYYKIGQWLERSPGGPDADKREFVIKGPGELEERIASAGDAYEKAVGLAVQAVTLAVQNERYSEHLRKFSKAKEAAK